MKPTRIVVGEIVRRRGVVMRIVKVARDGTVFAETVRGVVETISPSDARLIRSADREVASMFEDFYNPYLHVRAMRRIQRVLDWWARLLPVRVVSEDLGDYREKIQRLISEGQPLRAYWTLVAAIVSTAMNSVGYALRQFGKAPLPLSQQQSGTSRQDLSSPECPKWLSSFR